MKYLRTIYSIYKTKYLVDKKLICICYDLYNLCISYFTGCSHSFPGGGVGLFPLLLSISLFKKCVIRQLIDYLTINQLIEIDNLSNNYSGENDITLT